MCLGCGGQQARPTMDVSSLTVAVTFAARFASGKNTRDPPCFQPTLAVEQGCDLGIYSVCAGASMFPEEVRTFFSAGQRVASPQGSLEGVRFAPPSPRFALGLHFCHP